MAVPQFQIKKATKQQSKLRLSIAGPSGAGKTYTALKLATGLGGKIGVIDTERGSASKYADEFEFDVIELEDFHPQNFIGAIKAFEQGGYDIIVIDSTTHEWNGKNGILELHEAEVSRQRTKNSYTAWAQITPLHTAFIDAILGSRCHVIATVRSKTDYVQERNDRGQTEIRKVGMATIQREGMDYEYDIQLELDIQHTGVITKTRCAALDGRVFKKPGAELSDILKQWLTTGVVSESTLIETIKRLGGAAGFRSQKEAGIWLAAELEIEYGTQGFTLWLQSLGAARLRVAIQKLEALLQQYEAEQAEVTDAAGRKAEAEAAAIAAQN